MLTLHEECTIYEISVKYIYDTNWLLREELEQCRMLSKENLVLNSKK